MNRSSFNPNKIIAPASPPLDNVLGGTSPAIDTFRGSTSPPLGGGTSPPLDTALVSTTPPLNNDLGSTSPPLDTALVSTTPPLNNDLGSTSPPLDTALVSTTPPLDNDLGGTSPPLGNDLGGTSPPAEGCPKGGVAHRVHKSQRVKSWSISINNIPIIRNFIENLPYNPSLSKLARDKRKAGILSEVLFWQQVHKRLFHEIDFDRQRIIGNYIVDFYVKTLGLIVEIDGRSHDNKQEYDAKRQRYLEDLGLRVYRITDFDVKHNLDIVMGDLESYIVREYGRDD